MSDDNAVNKVMGSVGLIFIGAVVILVLIAFRYEIMEWTISFAVLAVICFVLYLLAIAWGYLPNPNKKEFVSQSTIVITPPPSNNENQSLIDWDEYTEALPEYKPEPEKLMPSLASAEQTVPQVSNLKKTINLESDARTSELYRTFPFLNPTNRNSNVDAILAVTKRKIDLELNGISPPEAYARALQEVGSQYAKSNSIPTPTIKRW